MASKVMRLREKCVGHILWRNRRTTIFVFGCFTCDFRFARYKRLASKVMRHLEFRTSGSFYVVDACSIERAVPQTPQFDSLITFIGCPEPKISLLGKPEVAILDNSLPVNILTCKERFSGSAGSKHPKKLSLKNVI